MSPPLMTEDTLRRFEAATTEDELVRLLSEQGIGAPPVLGQVATPEQPIQMAQPAQAAKPIQPTGDIAGALGGAMSRKQFAQQEAPVDFLARLLAERPDTGVPDTLQNLKGIQEPGTTIAERLKGGVRGVARAGARALATGEIPSGQEALAGAGGMLKGLSEAATAFSTELATNPVLQDQIGQIAQALTAREPESFPFQMASGIRASAQSRQADLLRQSIIGRLAGREPGDDVDIDVSILPLGMQEQITQSLVGEISSLASAQRDIAGIPTPEERLQEFEQNEAQIALTNARYLEIIKTLTDAGVVDRFDAGQLSLMRYVTAKANSTAAMTHSYTGMGIGPGGEKTYLWKNPKEAIKMVQEIESFMFENLIRVKKLDEAATILTTFPEEGADVTPPEIRGLDKTPPPDSVLKDTRLKQGARYVGNSTEDGKTTYWFDETGQGRITVGIR